MLGAHIHYLRMGKDMADKIGWVDQTPDEKRPAPYSPDTQPVRMFENKERAEKRHGDRDGKQERRKDLFEGSNRNIARKPQAKRYANGGNDEKPLFHTTNLQNPLQKVK